MSKQFTSAQISWDDELSTWIVQWRNADGILWSSTIDYADRDDSVERLADRFEKEIVNACYSWLGASAKVAVIRDDRTVGTITVRDGEVVAWRAV